MIQSISSVNINNTNNNTRPATTIKGQNPSFKAGSSNQKPSAVGWAAGQFAMGAAISLIIDGLWAGGSKLFSQTPQLPSFKQLATRAGFWGVAWLAIGLLLEGVYAARKNKQK